jgi:branched-chain amino acid transport system ATP-binding protein
MSEALEIHGLTVMRGSKRVVDAVSMRVEPGMTVALLGPNGAGKSSLVLALAGALPILSGSVSVAGRVVSGLAPHLIRRAGIAAVPEGHQVLTRLTVRENIEVAAAVHPPAALATSMARAYDVFPELRELADRSAGSLSGGQQQMLALAQALIARPRFLLADEMSLGLAPIVVRRLMTVLAQIAEEGIGVLLIEQFTHLALELADNAYVINRGQIRFEGSAEELKANPGVLQAAYLAGVA